MKKVLFNTLLAEPDATLLAQYNTQRLAQQIDDARQNPAAHVFKVGHPQGHIDVPGKRGWIYAQRMLPGGTGSDSVTVQVYVPSNAKGKTRVKYKYGQPIVPRRTGDRNPTYWIHDGQPPAAPVKACNCDMPGGCGPDVTQCDYSGESYGGATTSTGGNNAGNSTSRLAIVSVLSYPCDPVAGCITREQKVCFPANTNPADIPNFIAWDSSAGASACAVSGVGTGSPPGSIPTTKCNIIADDSGNLGGRGYDYYSGSGPGGSLNPDFPTGDAGNGNVQDDGWNDSNPVLTPQLSPTPPFPPAMQELWFDGLFTRRYNGTGPTGWAIVQGPTSGVFSEYKAGAGIDPYKVVYKTSGERAVEVAQATNTSIANAVTGLALVGGSTGKIIVVQESGVVPYPNAYTIGTRLFIGDDGRLTDAVPIESSGKVLQQMATVSNSKEILLTPQPAVIRTA